MARRLQDGDPGGHVRRALAAFPSRAIAGRVLDRYFLEGGRPAGRPYRPHPTLTVTPARDAVELSLVGNFVEVWLAKEGHDGLVGINLLEKIQTATPSACLGAMLGGVDYVLVGAGVPRELPRLLNDFAAGRTGQLTIEVAGGTRTHRASLDPVDYLGADLPALRRPRFLAIVSLHVLAGYLSRDEEIRPDGFIVEGPRAGGHSAPPRGKLLLDEAGDPVYGPKDEADLAKMALTGLPFWLAGGFDTPAKVAEALAAGAAGVQVGTVFALAAESALRDDLHRQLLAHLGAGALVVHNDPLASPTGFPFKIAEVAGSLSEPELQAARERICDLGYLRTPVERPDGTLAYRCSAEPVHMYVRKGGLEADTVGRKCLCNALFANIGLGQTRHDGRVELPAVTLGQDLDGSSALLRLHPEGWTAADAVDWLTAAASGEPVKASARA